MDLLKPGDLFEDSDGLHMILKKDEEDVVKHKDEEFIYYKVLHFQTMKIFSVLLGEIDENDVFELEESVNVKTIKDVEVSQILNHLNY